MALAAEAGIRAAGTRLVEVDHRSLLLVERFDRIGLLEGGANLRSGAGDFGLKPAEASNILDPCIEVARRMLRELDRVGLPIEQRNRILECRCEAA